MSKRRPKSDYIYVRVTAESKCRIYNTAERFGDPPTVIRAVLEAFAEGRVTIAPPPDKESLYVTGS